MTPLKALLKSGHDGRDARQKFIYLRHSRLHWAWKFLTLLHIHLQSNTAGRDHGCLKRQVQKQFILMHFAMQNADFEKLFWYLSSK